jgi:hypothetical protein
MLFKNSVRTSKRTAHFTITKINWLMMFKEITAAHSENHTKPIIIIIIWLYSPVRALVSPMGFRKK